MMPSPRPSIAKMRNGLVPWISTRLAISSPTHELLRFHGPDGAIVSSAWTFPAMKTGNRGVTGSLVTRKISPEIAGRSVCLECHFDTITNLKPRLRVLAIQVLIGDVDRSLIRIHILDLPVKSACVLNIYDLGRCMALGNDTEIDHTWVKDGITPGGSGNFQFCLGSIFRAGHGHVNCENLGSKEPPAIKGNFKYP